MKLQNISRHMVMALAALLTLGAATLTDFNAEAASKTKRKASTRTAAKSKKRSTSKPRAVAMQTVYSNPETGEWIHKGRRGIIIHRDSMGTVRAMTPYTGSGDQGRGYAEVINAYARELAGDGVRVYSMVEPTQGEFYMPEQTSTMGAEKRAIENFSSHLDKSVTPIFIVDTLANHKAEEIYNRTDHHWSPLGAHYAASAVARAAGVKFRPLSDYTTDTVRNYVGTMYKFSGDPAVKQNPEEFVYFMPPTGYKSEFITYRLSGGHTVGESEPHEEPFFRKFPDGSGAAYCTFMGGDSRTVKVTNTGGTPGRRLLIVKDSYGNAVASNLFGSFEEVHVADFRYYPHSLIDYIRDNKITDFVIANCISLAFAPNTTARYETMLRGKKSSAPAQESSDDNDADDEEDNEDND